MVLNFLGVRHDQPSNILNVYLNALMEQEALFNYNIEAVAFVKTILPLGLFLLLLLLLLLYVGCGA